MRGFPRTKVLKTWEYCMYFPLFRTARMGKKTHHPAEDDLFRGSLSNTSAKEIVQRLNKCLSLGSADLQLVAAHHCGEAPHGGDEIQIDQIAAVAPDKGLAVQLGFDLFQIPVAVEQVAGGVVDDSVAGNFDVLELGGGQTNQTVGGVDDDLRLTAGVEAAQRRWSFSAKLA